jgi:formamidopyrimidine-DNA glycosylase
MIELPQDLSISEYNDSNICGKRICKITATPNAHLRFYGETEEYFKLLVGKAVDRVSHFIGLIQVKVGKITVVFGDSVELKYYEANKKSLDKHPFAIEFSDGSIILASAELYGAIWCFNEEEMDNPYCGAQT